MSFFSDLVRGKPRQDVWHNLQGEWFRSGETMNFSPESVMAEYQRIYGNQMDPNWIDPNVKAQGEANVAGALQAPEASARANVANKVLRGTTGGLGLMLAGGEREAEAQAQQKAMNDLLTDLQSGAYNRAMGLRGEAESEFEQRKAGWEAGEQHRRGANVKGLEDTAAAIAAIVAMMA